MQKKNSFKLRHWLLTAIILCLVESVVTPVEAFPLKIPLTFQNTSKQHTLRNSNTNKATHYKIITGNTNILGENSPAYSKVLVAYKVKLSQKATIESLGIYINKSSGTMRLGIYTNSGDTPAKLLVSTAKFKPVKGWNVKTVIPKISLAAGYYWLCFRTDGTATIKASATGGCSVYSQKVRYILMPAKFPKVNRRGTWQYSFYATLFTNKPVVTPTPTRTVIKKLTPTSTKTPTATLTSTVTKSPVRTPAPTVSKTVIPSGSATPTPTSTIQITPREWYKYRQGKEMSGHSEGSASMINAPALQWKYDIAGWSGYYTAKLSVGKQDWKSIPYHTNVNASFYENNKSKWGLGVPCYDFYGNGTLIAVPDNPAVKVADILPDRKGLERITVESYDQVGDNARARLYAYNNGIQQQVWQSETLSTCYGPVVTVADANNDAQPDIIIAMHYRLVVLNGATGAIMMNLNYCNQRNYGFLGIANIDADPYPEFAVISDFAEHIEVIDNNGSNLLLKWFKQIENSIFSNRCITEPGPDAFIDLDHDGQTEIICNIFNYNNNNHWSIKIFNASDGKLKYELENFYLNGLTDLNKDGFYEMFLTGTYGLEVPTYGSLSVYRFTPGNKVIQLWTYPNARFDVQEMSKLSPTVNTMAANGRNTIVHGYVKSNLREDFFISEPGPKEGGETCKCFGFDDNNRIQNWLSINGPSNSRISALASAETDQPADGNNILLSVSTRGGPNEMIMSSNSLLELKQWGRKALQYAAPPAVADLDGDGKMEIIGLTGNGEVVCLDTPRFNTGALPRERWRMKGQGMSKDADNQQDGVLIADLDSDGRKEVIFAQESLDGKASIVAVRPDGSIKWQHVFSGFDGSAPKWNLGGVTYWIAGNFTTKTNLDLYVSIRRSKMHSDVGFLINGFNGKIIWESDGIALPGGNAEEDKRGHGGDRVSCADMDKDGLDELVCAYPDRVYIVNGITGEPDVIKNTAGSLFPQKFVYYAAPVLVNMLGDIKPEIFYGRCGYITALLDNNCKVLWERDDDPKGNNGCNYLQGIGDFDKSGKLEIGGTYKNAKGEYEFRFYKGSSGESIATFPLPAGFGSPCTDIVTADLDGDGCDEFLFGQGTSLQCMGQKGLEWTLNLEATPGGIALADPDRDGKLEIIVSTSDGYIKVYK